jgi:hypothetical protein
MICRGNAADSSTDRRLLTVWCHPFPLPFPGVHIRHAWLSYRILKLKPEQTAKLVCGPWLRGDGHQTARVRVADQREYLVYIDNATWIPYVQGCENIPFDEHEIISITITNEDIDWVICNRQVSKLLNDGIVDPDTSVKT